MNILLIAGTGMIGSRIAGELDWTDFSPAAEIFPGEKLGGVQLGTDALVVDAEGASRISAEDYAAALVDELEQGDHLRQRMTAAYA